MNGASSSPKDGAAADWPFESSISYSDDVVQGSSILYVDDDADI